MIISWLTAVGQALIYALADPNAANKLRGSTPLHAAALGRATWSKLTGKGAGTFFFSRSIPDLRCDLLIFHDLVESLA